MTEPQFCGKCGELIPTSNNYCSKCGTKKESSTLPRESKLIMYETVVSKVQVVLGVIVFLGGIYISSPVSIILGIVLFCIGFVRWKSKSKTLRQLMDIIGWIMLAAIIINFLEF